MSKWYSKVKADLAHVISAIDYFDHEFNKAQSETKITGSLEANSREIPGIVATRFAQLQEIESILEYLNIKHRQTVRSHYRKYLEHYNRALSSRDAEKFAENEQECIDMEHLVNEFALVRNKYLALMKGLEAKQFQVGHVIKLRVAGLDDVHF